MNSLLTFGASFSPANDICCSVASSDTSAIGLKLLLMFVNLRSSSGYSSRSTSKSSSSSYSFLFSVSSRRLLIASSSSIFAWWVLSNYSWVFSDSLASYSNVLLLCLSLSSSSNWSLILVPKVCYAPVKVLPAIYDSSKLSLIASCMSDWLETMLWLSGLCFMTSARIVVLSWPYDCLESWFGSMKASSVDERTYARLMICV